MNNENIWKGWKFEENVLISPNGDRITERNVLVSLFVRQMETYKRVLYVKPAKQEIN